MSFLKSTARNVAHPVLTGVIFPLISLQPGLNFHWLISVSWQSEGCKCQKFSCNNRNSCYFTTKPLYFRLSGFIEKRAKLWISGNFDDRYFPHWWSKICFMFWMMIALLCPSVWEVGIKGGVCFVMCVWIFQVGNLLTPRAFSIEIRSDDSLCISIWWSWWSVPHAPKSPGPWGAPGQGPRGPHHLVLGACQRPFGPRGPLGIGPWPKDP